MKKILYSVILILHLMGMMIGFLGLVLDLVSRIVMLQFRGMKFFWEKYLEDSKHIL